MSNLQRLVEGSLSRWNGSSTKVIVHCRHKITHCKKTILIMMI